MSRNVKNSELLNVLKEELEYKKGIEADWDTECSICYSDIFVKDTFYFMGNKKKVCQACMGNMIDIIDEI